MFGNVNTKADDSLLSEFDKSMAHQNCGSSTLETPIYPSIKPDSFEDDNIYGINMVEVILLVTKLPNC